MELGDVENALHTPLDQMKDDMDKACKEERIFDVCSRVQKTLDSALRALTPIGGKVDLAKQIPSVRWLTQLDCGGPGAVGGEDWVEKMLSAEMYPTGSLIYDWVIGVGFMRSPV